MLLLLTRILQFCIYINHKTDYSRQKNKEIIITTIMLILLSLTKTKKNFVLNLCKTTKHRQHIQIINNNNNNNNNKYNMLLL